MQRREPANARKQVVDKLRRRLEFVEIYFSSNNKDGVGLRDGADGSGKAAQKHSGHLANTEWRGGKKEREHSKTI